MAELRTDQVEQAGNQHCVDKQLLTHLSED